MRFLVGPRGGGGELQTGCRGRNARVSRSKVGLLMGVDAALGVARHRDPRAVVMKMSR